MTRSLVVGLAALVLSSFAACSGATTTKNAAAPQPAAAATAPSSASTTAAADAHALRRSAVRGVVKGGLGLFLQHLALDDEPVLKDGHFHGFRIAALHDPAFWKGVDVRPGDVIVRVNGMPIEHPEEALEAFHSLEKASELRVFYEREGDPRELTYPIVDDEPREPQKHADASAP